MKTKQQFTDRWKKHLAGLALYGVASETHDGILTRAGKVLEIPAEVERLLGMMYDELSATDEVMPMNGKPKANDQRVAAPGSTPGR